jgi:hypothetical protein
MTSGGGETSRLLARNEHESIAIITAGIEADHLLGIDNVQVLQSQLQDWNNLRTRYPNVTITEVTPARELAKHTLLSNRDAWLRIRERLMVADIIGWREVTLLVTGAEVRLVCIRCRDEFDVDDPSYMTRGVDGQPVCSQCAVQMLPDERLALTSISRPLTRGL